MTAETIEQPSQVPRDVIELKVRQAVAKSLELDLDEVQLSNSFEQDLGAQSLDMLDIAFALEREFRIQFPQTDLLQRASSQFGEDALVQDGKVTDFGLELLRAGMPEIDPRRLESGTLAADVVKLITVGTFVRLVERLLQAKQDFPRACPACGSLTRESEVMPELVCPSCGDVRSLPTGDEILLHDLLSLAGAATPESDHANATVDGLESDHLRSGGPTMNSAPARGSARDGADGGV